MNRIRQRFSALLSLVGQYSGTDMAYIAKTGFWGNLGTASVSLFTLALYFVFANYVSRETFGTYQYLLSLGAILGVLTFTGMNTAVTTAIAKGHDGALRQAMRVQLRFAFVPVFAAGCVSAYYFTHGNDVLGW